MRSRQSAVFPFAVAGLLLAGWFLSASAQAQSTGKPASAPRPAGEAADQASGSSARRQERDDVSRRLEWFYRQRRYPLKQIPGGAQDHAIRQREAARKLLVERGKLADGPNGNTPSFNAWTPIGPTPTAASGFDFLNQTFLATNFSGRINAIAVDPSSPSTVYLGGADGGLWKSTDGGANWVPLTDTQPSLAIGAIAIDPSAASCGSGSCLTLYVGTGEANFAGDNYYGAGILKSIDGGASFTPLGVDAGSVTLKAGYTPPPGIPAPNSFVGPFSVALGGSFFSDIVVNPAPGHNQQLLAAVRIFANADSGGSSGIFCSDDGGTSWLQVVAGAPGTALVISPDGTTAYGALGNIVGDPDNGVYQSTTALMPCPMQSWTRLAGTGANTIPVGSQTGRISLAISPSTPATLYAAIANPASASNDLLNVYKTTDSGAHWSGTNAPDICASQCWYDMTIKVHPNNANVVFLGGSAVGSSKAANDGYLLRSLNGGTPWDDGTLTTEIAFDGTNEIHVDQHAIAFSPPTPGAGTYTMFVGNDGGAWKTLIGATGTGIVSWTDLNSTLTLSQFYPGMSIHPSSPLVSYGGLQDNGSQKYDAITVPGSSIWNQVLFADGGSTYIDPAVPSTVYGTTEFINGIAFFIDKSVTGGDLDSSGNITFASATFGIDNANDYAEFIPPLSGDPSPGNNRVLYYGTCRVYQTRDGAANWSPMTGSSLCPAGIADYTTVAAAADGKTVYAGDDIGHVHMTSSAQNGVSAVWADVTGTPYTPLPGASSVTNPLDGRVITKISVSLNNPQFALVGYSGFCGFQDTVTSSTDNVGHIFQTTNGGASWTDISGGCNAAGTSLPNTPVNDIVIDPADPTNHTIYVATDVGVFMTSDDGATWLPVDQTPHTLPNGAVLSLTLRNESRTLRAGLHGRGVWDLQLASGFPAYGLASIAPVFAPQGSGSNVMLTVNGEGFSGGDSVLFNGVMLTTTFVTANKLTAMIPAALLANAGTASITVNGASGTTNALPFSVVKLYNAAALAPGNDAFSGAIAIASPSLSFSDTQNTGNATANTGGMQDPTSLVSSGCVANSQQLISNGDANSIWYSFTPPVNETIEADTVGSLIPLNPEIGGSEADTILAVVTGSPGHFTQVACNDDTEPGQTTISRVSFNATSGTTYYFMVSQYEGVGGLTVFNFNATISAPTLSSLSPNGMLLGTSQMVTLTGSNFISGASFAVNIAGGTGISVSNPVVVNSTTITAMFTALANATPNSQMVSVTTAGGLSNNLPFGVGTDFTLSANPTSGSALRGAMSASMLTIHPAMNSAFPANVVLTCSGLPSESSCVFTSSAAGFTPGTTGTLPATDGSAGDAQITVTFNTTAPSLLAPPGRDAWGPASAPPLIVLAWTTLFLALAAAFALAAGRRRARLRWALASLLILSLAGLAAACGGGGSSGGGGGGGGNPGTPPGTYMITVTATSGNVMHSTNYSLTVQ